MTNEQTKREVALKRVAHYDSEYRKLILWLSPNMMGERECDSIGNAETMIIATGIAQSLTVD